MTTGETILTPERKREIELHLRSVLPQADPSEEAWGMAMELVRGYIIHLHAGAPDMEDILQDMSLVVREGLTDYNPRGAGIFTWLVMKIKQARWGVAYRAGAQKRRGLLVSLDQPVGEDGDMTLGDTLAEEEKGTPSVHDYDILKVGLNELSSWERYCLEKNKLEGVTLHRIASMRRCTHQAVSAAIKRAMIKLKGVEIEGRALKRGGIMRKYRMGKSPGRRGYAPEAVEKVYEDYLRLKSCGRVAKLYHTSRQSIWDILTTHGKVLKPQARNDARQWVMRGGLKYSPKSYGSARTQYMTATTGHRKCLHRVKWEEVHGVIPKTHELVFLDGNTFNCDLSNIVLQKKGNNLLKNRLTGEKSAV